MLSIFLKWKKKSSLKIMLRQIELAEGFTETFYLEGVVLIDFIKKILLKLNGNFLV